MHHKSCGGMWDVSRCYTLTSHPMRLCIWRLDLVFFQISFPADTIETNYDTTAMAALTNGAPLSLSARNDLRIAKKP